MISSELRKEGYGFHLWERGGRGKESHTDLDRVSSCISSTEPGTPPLVEWFLSAPLPHPTPPPQKGRQ